MLIVDSSNTMCDGHTTTLYQWPRYDLVNMRRLKFDICIKTDCSRLISCLLHVQSCIWSFSFFLQAIGPWGLEVREYCLEFTNQSVHYTKATYTSYIITCNNQRETFTYGISTVITYYTSFTVYALPCTSIRRDSVNKLWGIIHTTWVCWKIKKKLKNWKSNQMNNTLSLLNSRSDTDKYVLNADFYWVRQNHTHKYMQIM